MAIPGCAATDKQLSEALFRQACYDFVNGDRIFDPGDAFSSASALALAQFQQCCEKAIKSVILAEVGRTYMRPSHCVWSLDLQPEALERRTWSDSYTDGELRKLRLEVEKTISQDACRLVSTLESFAPILSWEQANPEYPWVGQQGEVQIPAEIFDRATVAPYRKLARSVLGCIAVKYAGFKKIKAEVVHK